MPDVAIGAFVAVWIDHATARADVPLPRCSWRRTPFMPWQLKSCQSRRHAGLERLLRRGRGRARAPDLKEYGLALARVAQEAGSLDKRMARTRHPQSTLGERLMMGLDLNSNAWVAFSSAYIRGHK